MAKRSHIGVPPAPVYSPIRPLALVASQSQPGSYNTNWTPPVAQQDPFWKTRPPPTVFSTTSEVQSPVFIRPPEVQTPVFVSPPAIQPSVFTNHPSVQPPAFISPSAAQTASFSSPPAGQTSIYPPSNSISQVREKSYYGVSTWQEIPSVTSHVNTSEWKNCSSTSSQRLSTISDQSSNSKTYGGCPLSQDYSPPSSSYSVSLDNLLPAQQSWSGDSQEKNWTMQTMIHPRSKAHDSPWNKDEFLAVGKSKEERRPCRSQKHMRVKHRKSVLCHVKISDEKPGDQSIADIDNKDEKQLSNDDMSMKDDKQPSNGGKGSADGEKRVENEQKTSASSHLSHSRRKLHGWDSYSRVEKKNISGEKTGKGQTKVEGSLKNQIKEKRDKVREHRKKRLKKKKLELKQYAKQHSRSKSMEIRLKDTNEMKLDSNRHNQEKNSDHKQTFESLNNNKSKFDLMETVMPSLKSNKSDEKICSGKEIEKTSFEMLLKDNSTYYKDISISKYPNLSLESSNDKKHPQLENSGYPEVILKSHDSNGRACSRERTHSKDIPKSIKHHQLENRDSSYSELLSKYCKSDKKHHYPESKGANYSEPTRKSLKESEGTHHRTESSERRYSHHTSNSSKKRDKKYSVTEPRIKKQLDSRSGFDRRNCTPELREKKQLDSKSSLDRRNCTPELSERKKKQLDSRSSMDRRNYTPESREKKQLDSRSSLDRRNCTPESRERKQLDSRSIDRRNCTPELREKKQLNSRSSIDRRICTPETREKRSRESSPTPVGNREKKHHHDESELSEKDSSLKPSSWKYKNDRDKRHHSPEIRERRHQDRSSNMRHSGSKSREDYSRERKKDEIFARSASRYRCHSSRHDRMRMEPLSPMMIQTSGEDEDSQDDMDLLCSEVLWIRSSPAELYYERSPEDPRVVQGTAKLQTLHENFKSELIERASRSKALKPKYEPPPRKTKLRIPKPPKTDSTSSSSTSDESESDDEEDKALEELERKKKHPDRLHKELWYNDPGEMNDGPVCRCSAKARRSGIRHGIYTGEPPLPPCDPKSNNAGKLFHYRITMSPHTNFLTKYPTTIKHDGHEFIFEGFSMFSHSRLEELPTCKVIRFNIEYAILYIEEKFPDNFTVEGLELFSSFLFNEILELVDLDWKAHGDHFGCPRFHFMPRFARELEDNGKELLSMNVVLQYLLNSNKSVVPEDQLENLMSMSQSEWQDFADEVKGMIVTYPGMKPCSLRVDQLDREQCKPEKKIFPEIVHFGVRPPQLSYTGNPSYQKAWRDYVKFRHLLANKPKVMYYDRHKLLQKEINLQEMRMKNNLKRDVTVVISSRYFYRTGVMCDIVQHAMLLPVLFCHLRFHQSLDLLEERIKHKFNERYLLQCALTHPSYRENFGTNPDHARNSLTNCGIRQPEYGDRRIHYLNTRKRGINTLINIMSRFGQREETTSTINHNERLEFLGDAVVEFLSSIHLFFLFPDLEEGGLATYRAAIVQNQHLAVLAKKLQLEKFMLYAHGSDLCHDLELRHAMANCFEALMGALFLDSGIEIADKVFSETLFTEPELLDVWVNYPPHPLQEQEPDGDRKWIDSVPLLQKLRKFEEAIGVEFTHVRLLARSFTHCSVGFNNLTLGSNQRLEFLGDTVLQLVASEYLYKYFPEHHEGHLSLLRSSLVNNRTQAVVCDDLCMVEYAIYLYPIGDLKTKDRADLLEAFLGALYVDKGLDYCQVFCEVCFFPRLQDFIMNQDWNDPKSKLQQCCLTLRTMEGGEPDIPVYKVIECKGPTNTRVYKVAVYFRERRLASGVGHSIQQAEMVAALNALQTSKNLFPQLVHQKRVIQRSLKQQKRHGRSSRER